MLVTEFGMVTEVRLVQPAKAPNSIFVTEFGMITEVRLVQPEKARFLLLSLYWVCLLM